ncbi:MAG: 2-succinyl-6-hydroxy-2,4-cyclohexadiene-1-carboxylate synthase [Chloroflexi bacterium]|nr:2-succinyl-6-hydroxy-2,4-cyclohexadiene-1-carboxylate synthase [Chloroflexota bacterium]
MKTRYRAANSGHRYCIEIGGAGAPLVLLHGFSGSAATWRAVSERLADCCQCFAIDLLGHGRSDAPADAIHYRMEFVAADIIDLLDELALTRPNLLGYSMGGRLALFLALHYPGRFGAFVLESASPGLADDGARAERRRRDNRLAEMIEKDGVASFVAAWERLSLWSTQTAAQIRAQRSQRLANRPRGLANSLRGMGTGAQPNLWHQLPNLTAPTCLFVGERDQKFRRTNRLMAVAMPQSSLSIIPAAGHNTHLENPGAFCQTLRTFLQRL